MSVCARAIHKRDTYIESDMGPEMEPDMGPDTGPDIKPDSKRKLISNLIVIHCIEVYYVHYNITHKYLLNIINKTPVLTLKP